MINNESYFYKIRQAYDMINNISSKSKSVIVFDIDNTLIDYFGNPIREVISFYNYVKQQGFIPVIITAREYTPLNVRATYDELEKHKISGYKQIYFRNRDIDDIEAFKRSSRKNVNKTLGNVVMSIGDSDWDIGEYGGIGILLR